MSACVVSTPNEKGRLVDYVHRLPKECPALRPGNSFNEVLKKKVEHKGSHLGHHLTGR